MVRTPDGPVAREAIVTFRITASMGTQLDGQRAFRGGMSRSTYIRWLIAQDAKRIEQEKTWDGA